MTLNDGEVNTEYIVEKLCLPIHMEKRLQALGMTSGTKVIVLNNKSGGTLIIKVRGTRFAIGKGISKNIEVRRVWYGS
ncbi:MAG: ferrous iron transport protein A [Firmicutes bacterium]|jgi:ferrous iron transport protein A|nr:ferrous iron transport protein A [Bacillota bacterium]